MRLDGNMISEVAGTAGPRVAILLGCYNGAAHLDEQLASLAAQTHANWVLLVSDDGSRDASAAIVEAFAARVGPERVRLRRGPGRGFLPNFLAMACDPGFDADYFAFCDQDDIWEPEKLARALQSIEHAGDRPALYCSRTRLTDEAGLDIGFSPLFRRPPCFRNALVQSLAGGNTMLFNRAARQLLETVGADVVVPSHDWWLYLLVTGADGLVIYDDWASVRYRQHAANLVGGNVGLKARLNRLGRLLEGRFGIWNSQHCAALAPHLELLTPHNRELFLLFCAARTDGVVGRLTRILRARLFRQTPIGNLGLYVAVLLNKF